MTDKDLLQHLLDYLVQQGYPEDSVLVNFMVGSKRADVVVADTETHAPLQIFVLKKQKSERAVEDGKKQIKKFLAETDTTNPDVSAYLIFPSEKEPYFTAVNPENGTMLPATFFNYQNLVQKSKNASASMLQGNKKRAVGNLKWATVMLMVVICAVLLLDLFNVIEITGYRLYLILMIVILVLLPYYETIKIANFELTQKNKKK